MNFTPKDMTVKNLFRTFTQFKIPVFQRDYSWDKQYYSKFIDDIINGISNDNKELNNSKYFIGTMVFCEGREESVIDVVDGQQRLTVMTILLSVISELLLSLGEEGLADVTFKYVKEKNDNNEYISHLISDSSYPYLDCYIQSLEKDHAPEIKTEEEKNLKETYSYLKNRLSFKNLENLSSFKEFTHKEILIAIRDQMLSSMVIAISTPDRNNAYMIFEILNAKGKSLASIDLIKNIIFEEFYGDPNGLEGLAEEKWELIKANLRTRGQSIGLATFYSHYWSSKYKKVTNAKLYDSFKTEFKKIKKPERKNEYINFIKDLEKESKRYIQIIHPILSEDYSNRQEYKWLLQSLESLNNDFGLVQTRIILLALLDIKEKELISNVKFKETIKYIENFVFLYTGVAKKPANFYESSFSKIAISLRKSNSKSQTNQIIDELLYKEFAKKEVTYQEFEKGFIALTYRKGRHSSNILTKYVIRKLSSHFNNEELFLPDNSIEHILNEVSSDPRTINIGNLINLETKLNHEADSINFAEKKEIYEKSRNIQLKKFMELYNDFSVDQIENRAKNLSKLYYEEILKKEI